MWHNLGRKEFVLIFVSFYLFEKKKLFKQIQIFLKICPFSNMVRKTNLLSISVVFSEIVYFLTKKEVLCEFPPKCFKTTEKHSLAVCDSIWGEKQFLLIFVPFYWFDQKHLLKQIQIFLRICPLSNMVRKTIFLSISVLVFAMSLLCLKERFSMNFPKNASKQQKSIV